ncbi:DUF397 domain-containing protein [Nocardia pneumoniae]|uniref:DUF397 domain-containing protein n=1 Tax=Nocardia pneumoniae TaxID=228601 RepID=UPI000A02F849|nr:DUF397 domain-containing protein [Nocardia pneumoniae]
MKLRGKLSRSGANAECVEFVFLDGRMVGVRDSKSPTGPALTFGVERRRITAEPGCGRASRWRHGVWHRLGRRWVAVPGCR